MKCGCLSPFRGFLLCFSGMVGLEGPNSQPPLPQPCSQVPQRCPCSCFHRVSPALSTRDRQRAGSEGIRAASGVALGIPSCPHTRGRCGHLRDVHKIWVPLCAHSKRSHSRSDCGASECTLRTSVLSQIPDTRSRSRMSLAVTGRRVAQSS